MNLYESGKNAELLKKTIDNLLLECKGNEGQHDEVIHRLFGFFGYDVGIVWVLLLILWTMKKGEAILYGPNEPHAYLGGEAIECMSASNNVVRGGLT